MNLYITLQEGTDIDLFNENLKVCLKGKKYYILGKYIRNNYNTIVIELEDSTDCRKSIIQCSEVIEVKESMKFYYSIKNISNSKYINSEVRKIMKKYNFKARVYNSHTKYGYTYIGLEISEFNPFDIIQRKKLYKLLMNIEGIQAIEAY